MLKKVENNLQARFWRWNIRREIPKFQRELAGIVGRKQSGEIIIFPPGLAWRNSLVQRPQHIARALAELGNLVFYIEPEISNEFEGFKQLTENFFLCHVPLQAFNILQYPFVITMTWNYPFAIQIPRARLIYDYVDHLQVFSGNIRKIEKQHKLLLKSAVIVLATSSTLYEQVKTIRPDAVLCPNGVEYDHFLASDSYPFEPPQDISPLLSTNLPVIGYIGALARWIDFELIEQVSKLRPDLIFLLIGPDHENSFPRKLLGMPNIFWLGEKSYNDIPIYLNFIDVAMIPFQVNEMTHAVSPLKLFEYMAAGKPVIVTPMEGSMHYLGVLNAKYPQDFSNQIDEALQLKSDDDFIGMIRKVASENTWEVRARQIMQVIEKNMSSVPSNN